MSNPNRQSKPPIERSEQNVQNWSFDNEFKVLAVEQLKYDGVALQREPSENTALQVDVSGSTTYVGIAPTGSTTDDAVWQIQKYDTSSGVSLEWADGDSNFDNVWDDRATGSYA